MRAAWILAVVCACGGPTRTAPPPAPPPPTPVAPAPPPPAKSLTAEAICDRFAVLKPKCPQFASLDMQRDECVNEFKTGLAAEATKPTIEAMGRCMVELDSCEEVVNCLTAAAEKGDSDKLHACDKGWATNKHREVSIGGAVGIPKAEYDARNGAKVTAFADAKSTKELPIEMCGIHAENQWLTTLHCKDGSQPVKPANVETFRHGSLGDGGRCGSIIDKYVVQCPEASYDIYIDAYICPLDH